MMCSFALTSHDHKVLHLRDQIQISLGLAEGLMQRRCMVLCSDKNQRDSIAGLQRRMLQDSKLDGKDPDKVHHVGYCDLSKWGRLSVPLIDEVSSWAARTLQLNPEMSSWVALR